MHSYDPGTSPALLMWTVEIPEGSVHVDLAKGEATLHVQNLCSAFDAFTVANSLDQTHPLGLVSAVIESLRIQWTGVKQRRSFNNKTTFRGEFIENSASIDVTATTPATEPPFTPKAQNGFEFIADPKTTVTHFAQIGFENNGALF